MVDDVLFTGPLHGVIAFIAVVVVMLAGAWEWSAFLGVQGNTVRAVYIAIIAALLASGAVVR